MSRVPGHARDALSLQAQELTDLRDVNKRLRANLVTLTADNKRLRAALFRISDDDGLDAIEKEDMARAALTEREKA